MKAALKKLCTVFAAVLLIALMSGCGQGRLSGTWSTKSGSSSIYFSGETISFDGENYYDFTIDDDYLTIFYPNITDKMIYTLDGDTLIIGDRLGLMTYTYYKD